MLTRVHVNYYAKEIKECRNRAARTSTLVIVAIDSDTGTVANRMNQLAVELKEARLAPTSDADPIVVFIPKRSVETWIYCLLGEMVDEETDYSSHTPSGADITAAAGVLWAWSRPNALVPGACVDSLRGSFPHWRRIA